MTTTLAPSRLPAVWSGVGVVAVLAATLMGVTMGPVSIAPWAAVREILDHLPMIDIDSVLSDRDAAIVWELRLPRVVLGLLVGATLAVAGAAYQGVFRNPLADPYLLGVAAGAGLGATIAIVNGAGDAAGFLDPVPLAAFAGGLVAVALTVALAGGATGRASPATVVLAGVAITSFMTALQTFVLQRNSEVIRQVYTWILGRLTTAGWGEVALLTPYVVVTTAVLLVHRRPLDVLAVGDDEAASLGLHVRRRRAVIVLAASLGTAAAVSVSGLIGFVGIIVPHTVRLMAGASNRIVLPLSVLLGAAFLVWTDLAARLVLEPSEIPIGVVTAFFGAPFFVVVLRTSRRSIA